jgi:hypothetical protein
MPVYVKMCPNADDWYFETSATIGLTAPMCSVNRDRTIACAMRLGASLALNAADRFAWIDFSRWIPNDEHGIEILEDATFQVYFTRFGVTITHNWRTILIPAGAKTTQPVLIYNYDSHCFHFCDRTHFWKESTIEKVLPKMFGALTTLPKVRRGRWVSVYDYMQQFDLSELENGCLRRPDFAN